MRAHGNEEEVLHQTALIEHDDEWGNRLPKDEEKAREIETRRALRQGGLRGARAGASAKADATADTPGAGEGEADAPEATGSHGDSKVVADAPQPSTPAINVYKDRRPMVRDDTPVAPEMFNGTHNMPGENGMKWDPAMKREQDERDARER